MATEKRLIDAMNTVTKISKRVSALIQCGAHPTEVYNVVLDTIAEAPTVDAVEVSEYDSIVYKLECLLCHATGGKYSKASYSLADMERMVTDYIETRCDEAVAEEVMHGHWEPRKDVPVFVRCSACHDCNIYDDWPDGKKWNYCPNCGADMRERKENNNAEN